MKSVRHGLSVGIERINEEFFISFKIAGKLEHADYEVMVPMIESALEGVDQPQISAYIDCTELEGWSLRASWDDLKFGLKHARQFNRIALVGNKRWQEIASKVGNWFIAGETRYFDDSASALQWLAD